MTRAKQFLHENTTCACKLQYCWTVETRCKLYLQWSGNARRISEVKKRLFVPSVISSQWMERILTYTIGDWLKMTNGTNRRRLTSTRAMTLFALLNLIVVTILDVVNVAIMNNHDRYAQK